MRYASIPQQLEMDTSVSKLPCIQDPWQERLGRWPQKLTPGRTWADTKRLGYNATQMFDVVLLAANFLSKCPRRIDLSRWSTVNCPHVLSLRWWSCRSIDGSKSSNQTEHVNTIELPMAVMELVILTDLPQVSISFVILS